MSMFGLLWANLFRKKTRTTLTLLSVAIAFLLFMLLRAVSGAFAGGVLLAGTDRLIVQAKFSQIDNLPYNQKQQILAVDGVASITHSSWFGGNYQEPANFFPKFPVDPLSFFEIHSEYDLQPIEALQKFASQRTAAVVDVALVERYGWKIGDTIPIMATIYPKASGERLWEFELVGIFSEAGKGSSFPLFLFHYDYFNEAVSEFAKNQVGNWTLRLSEPDRADEIARTIDDLFENSADPTRTATEDEVSRQFAEQLGDMGFITSMIMSAVFFTIILLTGNTMSQALRERIPELAVLKTLGFTDATVSWMIMGEAVLLCLAGGALGIGMALLIEPAMAEGLKDVVGSFKMTWQMALTGLGLALVIGLLIGAIPALTSKRLVIVDALRQ